MNLIHIDDAVGAVLAAEQHAEPPALYLVADGRPVMRRDFYGRLAELLGVAAPTFDNSPPKPARRSATNKRIDPTRAMRELGLELTYPTYREGLAASVS